MATPLRILILEDNSDDAALMLYQLKQSGFDPRWTRVDTKAQYLAHLSSDLDLILADYNLPQFTGLEAFFLLNDYRLDIPFILVSGTVGEETAVDCIKKGITDYVLKDRMIRLGPKVIAALEQKRLREQKNQTEEALIQSEEQFRQLAENINEVFWLMDRKQGRVLYVSPQYSQVWKRSAKSIYDDANGWLNTVHPEDRSRVEAAFQQTIEDGRYDEEYRIVHPDGSIRWIRDRGFPIRDVHGNVYRVAGLAEDITERRIAEQERITKFKIERERNHLQDAVRALERVLGVVGHELRTPLAGMRALTELVLRGDSWTQEEISPSVQTLHTEILRMSEMVHDLLEVARMNSGLASWNWSSLNIYNVCCEAMNSVRPLINQEKIKLNIELTPQDLTIHGDASALRRLILNLLTNAQKHTQAGSITIRGSIINQNEVNFLQLQICDTGSGMSPHIASGLGVPFALNTGIVERSIVQGSGLGLAICNGILAAHGGSISLSTAPGEGTTVTILLPMNLKKPISSPAPTTIATEFIDRRTIQGDSPSVQ